MRKTKLVMWVALAVLVQGLFGISAFAEAPATGRIQRLNFPQLPVEVMDKIRGTKPVVSRSARPAKPDSGMSQEWGLAAIGFFEVFNPLIQPVKPAAVSGCSEEVVVAVIDTGIDYTHPELREHMWVNRGETGAWSGANPFCHDKSCNGIDDDKDGLIDDVIGWDFVNNVALPYDTHGHGTHIAGIISSSAANGLGASGVCPGVSVMALKYYDSSGLGYNNLQNTVKAIEYAVAHGAQIINYSGGGAEPAAAERAAIEYAQKKGVLFVAAAGNDGHDNATTPYYPASYGFDNIISVASVNEKNHLLPSSNFGRTVHVAAPGLAIYSALPGGKFGTMSGTSQATAFVSGAAALLASQTNQRSHFEFRAIRQFILNGSKPFLSPGKAIPVASGLLSLPSALTLAKDSSKTVPPAAQIAARPEAEASGRTTSRAR